MLRRIWLASIALILGGLSAGAEQPARPGALSYEANVRPILKARCFLCHGEGEKLKGGLDVRLCGLILKGGKNGPAIIPGKPGDSLLFQRVRDGEMPKNGKKLSGEELAAIEKWIAEGAKTARPEPKEVPAVYITEVERNFWAFQPVKRPPVPSAPGGIVLRTPIDAFVWAKLNEKGLSFSEEADKRTLIRRAYFDLIGLPPSPRDVEEFMADDSATAYERLVDKLLASPRYGERWGRHWLDVAGYAESDGFNENDTPRKYAYKYRDYVIRSFNDDKPFDQFIQEQLAGDEMVKPPYADLDSASIEKLAATGFLRMGPDGTESDDQKLARNQTVAETIKIVSTSLLGLTVGCAQCHDHRYDPIPQIDYYRLRAVFDPAYDLANWRKPSQRLISLGTAEQRQIADRIEQAAKEMEQKIAQKEKAMLEKVFEREIKRVPEEVREAVKTARNTPTNKRSAEQIKLLKEYPAADVQGHLNLYDPEASKEIDKDRAAVAEKRATKPVEDFIAPTTEQPGKMSESRLFYRGDLEQPKQAVSPGELTILAVHRATAEIPAKNPSVVTSGRRLAYARMLTDGSHPLTARVLVNRVWLHHFGRGIVATAGDFGMLGERPTHPELLDWLANDFVANGWRLKRLHRMIMTSGAYRQTSRRSARQDAVDPENRLVGRANVRRLEAETIRDSILAVSGKLNGAMSGPSIPVGEDREGQIIVGKQKRNVNNEAMGVDAIGEGEFRRSIYIQVRRKQPLAMLEAFDMPPMTPSCDVRRASTVATQSLMLLNDMFMVGQAEYVAKRLLREASDEPAALVRGAWEVAYAAEPTEKELQAAVRFLSQQETYFRSHQKPVDKGTDKSGDKDKPKAPPPDPKVQALTSLCQALLDSNRFLYVD